MDKRLIPFHLQIGSITFSNTFLKSGHKLSSDIRTSSSNVFMHNVWAIAYSRLVTVKFSIALLCTRFILQIVTEGNGMSAIEVAFGLTVMIIGCVNHLYHTWLIKDVTTSTTKVIIEAKNNLLIKKQNKNSNSFDFIHYCTNLSVMDNEESPTYLRPWIVVFLKYSFAFSWKSDLSFPFLSCELMRFRPGSLLRK